MENETLDEIYEYRGFSLQIWNDDYGKQKFLRFLNDPVFGTRDIGLGTYNFNYLQDVRDIIDEKLDTICYFYEFGARLKWFDNFGYRDIELTYRLRRIKIRVVGDPDKVNLETIKQEALEILKRTKSALDSTKQKLK